MCMTLAPYDKPFKPISGQIDLLRERGMRMDDEVQVAEWLRRAGYYRLSAYWFPFRCSEVIGEELKGDGVSRPNIKVHDDFRTGTTWAQVVELYEFDRGLRELVFDAIERVEVGLRFHVGHTLGRRGGAEAYRDPAHLNTAKVMTTDPKDRKGRTRHEVLLASIDRSIRYSTAQFVQHYRSTYRPHMPIWMLTELLSFGDLKWLYESLDKRDRNAIARDVGVLGPSGSGAGESLRAWWENLRYIRNTCAHHSRLWNLNVASRIADAHLTPFPTLMHAAGARQPRLYPTLAVLAFLTNRVHPADDWCWKLREYLEDYLPAGRSLKEMGFPPGWDGEDVWNFA